MVVSDKSWMWWKWEGVSKPGFLDDDEIALPWSDGSMSKMSRYPRSLRMPPWAGVRDPLLGLTAYLIPTELNPGRAETNKSFGARMPPVTSESSWRGCKIVADLYRS